MSSGHLPSAGQFHANKGRCTVEHTSPLRGQGLCPFLHGFIAIESLRHDANVLQVLTLEAGLEPRYRTNQEPIKNQSTVEDH